MRGSWRIARRRYKMARLKKNEIKYDDDYVEDKS